MLVVDNLEHLLPAAADLDAMLREVPSLTILATSREPLRLRREHLFEIHPYRCRHRARGLDRRQSGGDPRRPAVRGAGPGRGRDLRAVAGQCGAVAELSRRLEGLPLAVELAAARIRVLEPKALLARMHQSLALLRWEAPDLPPAIARCAPPLTGATSS